MATATELFQRHHLRVFRYLRKSTRSTERAEDLSQEVFVRVVSALRGYRPEGRDEAWILTIARNVLLNDRRSRSRRPQTVELDEAEEPFTAGIGPRSLDLERSLAELPEVDRDVFLLREVGGLGYDEIGTACDLTPDSVRSRIYRARLALRDALAGKETT